MFSTLFFFFRWKMKENFSLFVFLMFFHFKHTKISHVSRLLLLLLPLRKAFPMLFRCDDKLNPI